MLVSSIWSGDIELEPLLDTIYYYIDSRYICVFICIFVAAPDHTGAWHTLFSLLIPAPLLAGVQNIAGVTLRLRSTPGTDGLDSYVGLIVLVLLTSALVDH